MGVEVTTLLVLARLQMAIVKPFYEGFKILDLVIESSFGYELQNDHLEKISTFETKYKKANISLTLKLSH